MKWLALLLLFGPTSAFSQDRARLENDTIYTCRGYKIYTGQLLQFGTATGNTGFRHIHITNGVSYRSLENTSVRIREMTGIELTPGNESVDISGNIDFKDGSKGRISFRMAFEKAMGTIHSQKVGEWVVPEMFRSVKEPFELIYSPTFNDDTLTTSCGFNIYRGQLLQFGKSTGGRQRFRYVNIRSRVPPGMLQNNQVLIKELRDYGISKIGNGYITIIGNLYIQGNDRGPIELHIAFDLAIENIPGVPSEIIVPDRFRNRLKTDPDKDIARLTRMYEDGIISFAELEAFKKWLLAKQ